MMLCLLRIIHLGRVYHVTLLLVGRAMSTFEALRLDPARCTLGDGYGVFAVARHAEMFIIDSGLRL
jgi:hypothetical protein